MVGVFRQIRRVLAPHGTVWLNIGDTYNNRSVGRQSSHQGGLGFESDDLAKSWSELTGEGRTRLSIDDGELKEKDLIGVPWLLAFALRAGWSRCVGCDLELRTDLWPRWDGGRVCIDCLTAGRGSKIVRTEPGWWLRAGIVWCLSGGTRLYARTQKGEGPATLHDLVRLDPATVELWNGERWTRVRSWHQAETRGTPLEIEIASGERLRCTPGHVWPMQRGNVRADDLEPGDVLATTRLPEPANPDRPEFLPDEEIGWLVGRYLADGSVSEDVVQIACHDDEADALESRARSVAVALHGTATAHRTVGKSATVNMNGPLTVAVVRGYVHGSSAATKGLRARVWRRSDAFLRAVLIGYLEGDGHYDAKNDRWRLGFTRNDRLACDLRTLAARLGLPLRLSITHVTGFGRRWPAYRGQIRLDHSTHHNARQDGRIVAIRRSNGRNFWDVEVEDEPHLFALASGVLTHNSKPNGMPEAVSDRPTRSHEFVFLLAKSERYFYDQDSVREPFASTRGSGNVARKHGADVMAPGAHAGDLGRSIPWSPAVVHDPDVLTLDGSTPPAETPDGRKVTSIQAGADSIQHRDGERWPNPAGRNMRDVWTISPKPFKGAHFAVMPEEVARRAILAGCPEQVCRICGTPRRRVTISHATGSQRARSAGGLGKAASREPHGLEPVDGTFRENVVSETVGWTICGCLPDGTELFERDALELVDTPLGHGTGRTGIDPTPETGRRGLGRPRADDEGVRPITRYEQRRYAAQLKASPHRAEMEADAGDAFAHYVRTDRAGARPVPPDLLDRWIAAGWLTAVDPPDVSAADWPGKWRPGVVLDPFMGSGTTAKVARDHGRHAVGVEANAGYAQMCIDRNAQMTIFVEEGAA